MLNDDNNSKFLVNQDFMRQLRKFEFPSFRFSETENW